MGKEPKIRNLFVCLGNIVLFLLAAPFLYNSSLLAEPWLGNRYAQNCAGCHAPGRKNVAPMDRRCTLSCQGCHVNPNGGGLRSLYGKWNQDRWLRSFRTKSELVTKGPAPYKKQHYGKVPFTERNKKDDRLIYERGLPLVESEFTELNEKNYDRSDKLEHETSKSWKEFLYQIPEQDPYRLTELTRITAGGDLRYLWRSLVSESNSSELVLDTAQKWQSFLMSFDAGVDWRPIHRNLHFVYEGRIMGSPSDQIPLRSTLSQAGTRSLYAMIESLPFNTFIMGGYYRPLIGTSNADHNALSQRMIAQTLIGSSHAQSLLFEAISVGSAPNVPFANIHYIRRKKIIGGDIDGDRTQGFAINAGMRFVTLGAAVNATYWRTNDQNERSNEKTQVEIMTLGASAQFGRFIAGTEIIGLTKDADETDYRNGGVLSLESKFRLWREYYVFADLARASTTDALLPGSATQLKLGVRGFHFAGVETMLSFDMDEIQDKGEKGSLENKRSTSYLTGQIHVYF